MTPPEKPLSPAEAAVFDQIVLESVPVHVACVMDGNGRWAKQRGLERTAGHREGEKALTDVLEAAIRAGVKWLTAYAFSTENWSRPDDEVSFIMAYNEDILTHRSGELHEQGVRLVFAGRRGFPIPEGLQKRMDEAMELTRNNTRLNLVIAFNYGGRAEIVDALRSAVADGLDPAQINEETLHDYLYVPEMPDVDLMIRTSNELRISNFLLWEVAYAELYFTETLWPDFRKKEFFEAIVDFQRRQRRFGGLGE